MVKRTHLRVAAAVALLVCAGIVGAAYLSRPTSAVTDATGESARVAPANGTTVIATDSNTWLGRESDGPRANAELVAFGADGERRYYDDSHTRYWDVDPVEGTNATVEYLYADHLTPEECGGEGACTRNGIERVNLTTGSVEGIYSRVTAGKHSTRWHDGDRLSDSTYVVADIAADRVFVVNTTTGIVEWSWDAQAAFDPATTGGPYPSDWTHLNDVEVLESGHIQVSLRNHDRVVYLDRETGLIENRTLGNGSHGVLYEQHNPDYIENPTGDDAVLVADSENNRLVEYRDDDGRWVRSWHWRDAQLQWPRDADRLPNGHTLVTDSNGNRVFELDETGEVVWSVPIAFPYEAERLGTGDESAGGPPAHELGLRNQAAGGSTVGDGGPSQSSVLPGPVVNAVYYVLPRWMGVAELLVSCLGLAVGVLWAIAELRWLPYRVSLTNPVSLRKRK
ncbi:arylsulfotransferase (asst) [Haloferax sp. Atlit-10N]|uniref:aryl-sulfate sulfotransferase n=1 Tax=unclassified Haloferax TaxID=2625095 RepID=UPI000E23AD3C|nr:MULTISPECIES: aryl-sulfate sulfotransferase [unclassified Haloferax]RDZ42567.1 arylsulfotransferase (asst) [Haloferax sp. Atlit-16N]RDZ57440.1 arylsulfotransferase (asst) [Haloferax sp. Atlit-10N]